jgi:mono/diheme cytochrome c family protein
MAVIGFLALWILIGIGVIFVSFSGGPGAAREAYLTRGRRVFGVMIVLAYLGIGIAIPAVVIAAHGQKEGNDVALSQKTLSDQPAYVERGRQLFIQNCAACHTLGAVNARGVTGPNLDKIGTITPGRVESAINIGGTGQGRMPAGLLQGDNATAVAKYLSRVAGK